MPGRARVKDIRAKNHILLLFDAEDSAEAIHVEMVELSGMIERPRFHEYRGGSLVTRTARQSFNLMVRDLSPLRSGIFPCSLRKV